MFCTQKIRNKIILKIAKNRCSSCGKDYLPDITHALSGYGKIFFSLSPKIKDFKSPIYKTFSSLKSIKHTINMKKINLSKLVDFNDENIDTIYISCSNCNKVVYLEIDRKCLGKTF